MPPKLSTLFVANLPKQDTESFYKYIFSLFIQRYLPLVGHSFDGEEMTVLEMIQNWFIQVKS